jgi:hypothetical protein
VVVFNRLVNSLRTVLYLSSFWSSPFLVYAYARWNYFGGKSSFVLKNGLGLAPQSIYSFWNEQ